MLKKLRRKFVIINMAFTMTMLCAVFALIYFSTSHNLFNQSVQMMGNEATNPSPHEPPDLKNGELRLPNLSVHIDNEGNAEQVGNRFFDQYDEGVLDEIITAAQNSDKDIGTLNDYNLRYMRTSAQNGTIITFSDITYERSVLSGLISRFIIIGAMAFVILYIISTALARWAIGPVEKAWQQQKQFVADASHELKTPLTVVMTDAELLKSKECTDNDRNALPDAIIAMSKQMSGLVEELLELARIDAGKTKETPTDVSFGNIAEEVSMTFEPVFFEKGMSFTYNIDSDITVNAPAVHLKQLITIFLDNASKYAQDGAKVKLSLEKKNKKCLLCVSNQGEEISSNDLKHLFDRFYRADKVRTMNHSYGLGLSIAEGIVNESKGKIWAESKDGYNSFYAELPTK